MIRSLFVIVPLVMALPKLHVNWLADSRDSISISFEGDDELLPECVESGLEMEYSYEFELCRSRTAWFDSCGPERNERHRLRLEQISRQYQLTVDRHDDGKDPVVIVFDEKNAAVAGLQRIEAIPLEFLADGDEDLLAASDRYVSVQVSTRCKGEYSKTLRRISSVLTFGLVQLSGVDSGWESFTLAPQSE